MTTAVHNIYIHVPFCISKCNYCAFYSAAIKPDWEKYANGICAELADWAGRLGHFAVPTVFFGGGTPSLMPAEIFAKIMNKIADCFYLDADAEITIEANPGTITPRALDEFIAAGAGRLSVGVQSLDDARLQFLGRRHTAADARALIDAAMRRPIRFSADFIYGLPGDTADTVAAMCRDINALELQHCSMYELTIEPSTPFGKMHLNMPGNDEMAQMYAAIADTLTLPRYEVSNYAAPGQECRHNQNIWDGAPYIGVGRGAAGRIFKGGVWYEQLGAGALFKQMTAHDRATEKIITGMRTTRGVKLTPDVAAALDMEWAAAHPGLVRICGDRLCATETGMLTLDHMLIELTR